MPAAITSPVSRVCGAPAIWCPFTTTILSVLNGRTDAFSPFPVHGIDEAMGIKRTILPVLIFGGGVAGTVGGMFLQWWCNAYNWPWNISGKPAWSIPATTNP